MESDRTLPSVFNIGQTDPCATEAICMALSELNVGSILSMLPPILNCLPLRVALLPGELLAPDLLPPPFDKTPLLTIDRAVSQTAVATENPILNFIRQRSLSAAWSTSSAVKFYSLTLGSDELIFLHI